MRLGFLLGDQLSLALPTLRALDPARDCLLMTEVAAEAGHVAHHRRKLVFQFSAMRHFAETLRAAGWTLHYAELDDPHNSGSLAGELQRWVTALQPQEVHLTEAGDWRVEASLRACECVIHWHADSRFLCSRRAFAAWLEKCGAPRMELFYRQMRRRGDWLMQADGNPEGGRWNHDPQNRKRLPRGLRGPLAPGFTPDVITLEVLELVRRRFPDHPGALSGFDLAVTREQALELWRHFLDFALPAFGDYQDAMASGEPFLFHARISAALNLGLLEVRELCDDVQAAYHAGRAPLNAAEGFIRQLIGWREYVHGIYWARMPDYAELDFFGCSRPLPSFYWNGDTGMNCMRQVIGQTLQLAYAHHIQRLMVTGNFALLAGVVPKEVCDWYLAIYFDAVDWVELPNTLGMALHADGGFMASKPYCASGQYIRRMSDYCSDCRYRVGDSLGEQACPFNALYWHFLMRERDLLEGNPRLAPAYRLLADMAPERREALRERGDLLLARLDAGDSL